MASPPQSLFGSRVTFLVNSALTTTGIIMYAPYRDDGISAGQADSRMILGYVFLLLYLGNKVTFTHSSGVRLPLNHIPKPTYYRSLVRRFHAAANLLGWFIRR